MRKLIIKFRKRFILPLKWARREMDEVSLLKVRGKREIYDKILDVKKEIVQADRKNETKRMNIAIGKLAALKWVLQKINN